MVEAPLTSATSQPRSPSALTADPAMALLGEPGCPACRRAATSAGEYLMLLSSGGHASPEIVGRLVSSRGLCGRHTELLLTRPSAAAALTRVYRQLVVAVLQDLAFSPATCPACEREETAGDCVLDTLLNDLHANERQQYKLHGGLCLPHLRRAARRHPGANVRWLIRFMTIRLTGPRSDLDLLAGWQTWPTPDIKSPVAQPAARRADWSSCADRACGPCQASAGAQRAQLAAVISAADGTPPVAAGEELLCARHVRDLAQAAAGATPDPLLRQAESHARRLSRVLDGQPRLLGISPGWQSSRARQALAEPECRACRAGDAAASEQLGCFRLLPADGAGEPAADSPLCLRHLARLHAIDPRAGQAALGAATTAVAALATQLDLAAVGEPELAISASWRAARFLDGSV
jgi:hypothetical protein